MTPPSPASDAELPPDSAQTSPDGPPPTAGGPGVRFGYGVLLSLCALAAIPYGLARLPLSPELTEIVERCTPWRPEDPYPFSRLFRQSTGDASIAGAMRSAETLVSEDEILESALAGSQTREALPELPEIRPVEPRDEPLPFPRQAYAGLTRTIEDAPRSMAHFYDQLRRVAYGPEGTKARIIVYGTSLNGTDLVTHHIREGLAEHFGDGGKGFVPMARGWQGQRHQDVQWSHDRWRTNIVNRGQILNGRYGLGGVLARTGARGGESHFATVEDGPLNTRVSRFEVFFQVRPIGGDISVIVDEGEPEVVSTYAEELGDSRHIVNVPEGPHALEVRTAGGPVRLYGVVMENDSSGIVVDALSFIGAYSNVFLKFDEEHLATQIGYREPNLILFWMGGNDAAGPYGFDADEFVTEYSESIRRVRAGRPDASCLVMSVLDKGEMVRGTIRSLERVPLLAAAQRRAAEQAGCAFFDAYEASGGEGTARRWREHRPALLIADLGHLTENGATVVGALILKALLRGYAEHLDGIMERDSSATE